MIVYRCDRCLEEFGLKTKVFKMVLEEREVLTGAWDLCENCCQIVTRVLAPISQEAAKEERETLQIMKKEKAND